jgi:hypothetical protein
VAAAICKLLIYMEKKRAPASLAICETGSRSRTDHNPASRNDIKLAEAVRLKPAEALYALLLTAKDC